MKQGESKVIKKVVLDTNVLISSILIDKGNPYKIVNLAIEQKIQNHTSIYILKELENKLRNKFKESEEEIAKQISLVKIYSEVVEPKEKIKVIKDDPKDDMVLECGVASNADYIISGDNHLLKLKEYRGIRILTPAEFLEIIA